MTERVYIYRKITSAGHLYWTGVEWKKDFTKALLCPTKVQLPDACPYHMVGVDMNLVEVA